MFPLAVMCVDDTLDIVPPKIRLPAIVVSWFEKVITSSNCKNGPSADNNFK